MNKLFLFMPEESVDDKAIDLDDPLVILFRKVMLEQIAKEQKSDLYCSHCSTNLPYTHMTIGPVIEEAVDGNGNPIKISFDYFCTLCQKGFYNKKK